MKVNVVIELSVDETNEIQKILSIAPVISHYSNHKTLFLQPDKQTNNDTQTLWQTDRQISGKTDKHTNKQIDGKVNDEMPMMKHHLNTM